MSRYLALLVVLCLGLSTLNPAVAQTSQPTPMAATPDGDFEPIPLPENEPAGSSGPSAASMGSAGSTLGSIASTGSSILGIVGLVTVIAIAAVASSN